MKRLQVVLPLCGALLVLAVLAGVALGPVRLSPSAVVHVVMDHIRGRPLAGVADQIVWTIRLPRVLLAALVGAMLALAGTAVQALVRNPLADPFLLGISSGASVGATSVLLFGAFGVAGVWALSVGSILGALGATVLVFSLSRRDGQLAPTQLVLCGVVLAAMFEAVASFLLFRGNPQATQSVLFYLLGSFGRATWSSLFVPAAVLLPAFGYLVARARPLNALSLGTEAAWSLGVDVTRLRRGLFVTTAALAGVAVAVSGVIGFVGLVVPHIVRLLVRSDHRRVLPVAALIGGTFTVVADLLARTLVAPQEMPLGVVTAFLGAPVLLLLVRRRGSVYGAAQ